MSRLAYFIAGFILAIGFSGRAVEYFFEGGQCRFSDDRGAFYHADLPHQNYMTPRCGSFGVQDKFSDGNWGWRLGYLESGAIHARDNYTRMLDGEYETNLPCNWPAGYFGCHAVINGSGYMYGFTAAITRDFHVYDQWKVIPEGGLFFYRSVFRATIRAADFEFSKEWYVAEDSGWKAWPSPFIGLTIRYGPVYAAVRHYWPSGHRALSLTDHSFTQIMTGVVF